MRLNLTLSHKALILVAIPLVFELTFVGVLMHQLHQVDMERQREARAREISNHCNMLLRLLLQAGTDSVLWHLMQQRHFYERYHHISDQVHKESDDLRNMVESNAYERAKFAHMETLLQRIMAGMRQAHELIQEGDPRAAQRYWLIAHKSMDELFAQTDNFVEEQQKTQVDTKRAQQKYRQEVEQLLWFGVAFNVFLAVCLASYFNRGTSSRFDVLMDNTLRLASGQKLRPKLGGGDEIAHLDQFFRDMAKALEESRRKERAVVENAIDVICSVNSEGKFSAVNPACNHVWGYPADDLLGTRLVQIVHPDDIEKTNAAVKNIIDDVSCERSCASFENRIVRKDGTAADMLWSAHWSADEKALFCVAHDISERKQIERMKQDFVAMVSHDLRTPLTSIQGFLSLLSVRAYGELTKPGFESLEVTEANVSRLIALVNDLLDIEKMESGMLQLYPCETSLNPILLRSVQAVDGFARQQTVTLAIKAQEDIAIVADSDRLIQVVINLLSNAIKYSPKGETITVSVDDEGQTVRVNVEDNGRGVPEQMRESIFERFKQVERSDERQKGGSGLGLAICKAIIERHDGTIGVDGGADGKGSRFWFRIPKVQVENSSVFTTPAAVAEEDKHANIM